MPNFDFTELKKHERDARKKEQYKKDKGKLTPQERMAKIEELLGL